MKILVPLVEGLEEIEAITIIDVLRRAEIDVITAGLEARKIKGSHEVIIEADTIISQIKTEKFDGIVLPGGMPGATNLRDNGEVVEFIKILNNKGKLVAAICAAPIVLEKAGVIKGKQATSYPGFGEEMNSCDYKEKRVVRDGNIITARGPGVALEFALELVAYLVDKNKKKELQEGMLAEF